MKVAIILTSLLALINAAQIDQEVGRSPYVVGGKDASIKDYPFTVALYEGGIFGCTGSIISPNFVLTAGHCLPIDTIQYGLTQRSDDGPNFIKVNQSFLHPDYITFKKDDLALLKVSHRTWNILFTRALLTSSYKFV